MTARAGPRRIVPIGVLTLVAAVPAIALAIVWQYADANVSPPTTTTTTTLPPAPAQVLGTALLSLRRHPTPIAARVAEAATAEAQAASVSDLVAGFPDGSCIRVVHGADVIAEVDPLQPVIPASNEKLFVAATALAVLGLDYRFRTDLQAAPPVGGVVTGDVYLVGGGDPVLRTADVPDPLKYPSFNTTALEPLADQLVALGVTAIEGDVIGDGSRYDDEFRVPTWGDQITSADAGPYDALLVNDGLIGNGNYGLDPNRSAARRFYDLLVERGVMIGGTAGNAARPNDAGLTTLTSIESLPLAEIVVELLHTSDNNTAEMLVKEIGYVAMGAGSRRAGLSTVRATLAGWGVPLDGVVLDDGSGLSRENRATCAALVAVVAAPGVGDELRELLPVAGRDGTLAESLLGTGAEGRMQAKTGTLTDVKALTGSLPAGDGSRIEFSVVLNGADVDDVATYEPTWERLVSFVGDFPIVIPADVERFAPR